MHQNKSPVFCLNHKILVVTFYCKLQAVVNCNHNFCISLYTQESQQQSAVESEQAVKQQMQEVLMQKHDACFLMAE